QPVHAVARVRSSSTRVDDCFRICTDASQSSTSNVTAPEGYSPLPSLAGGGGDPPPPPSPPPPPCIIRHSRLRPPRPRRRRLRRLRIGWPSGPSCCGPPEGWKKLTGSLPF